MSGGKKPRQPKPVKIPRGFLPRYERAEVVRMNLAHIGNLNGIATGCANDSVLWDFIANALTWWHAACAMSRHEHAMAQQLDLAKRLVDRWARTGRVRFDGPDYQLAKFGVLVMDDLAECVDVPTAQAAAAWSQTQMALARIEADELRTLLATTTTPQHKAAA